MKDLACQKQGNISKDVSKHYFKSRGEMTGAWEELCEGGTEAPAVRRESKGQRSGAEKGSRSLQAANAGAELLGKLCLHSPTPQERP